LLTDRRKKLLKLLLLKNQKEEEEIHFFQEKLNLFGYWFGLILNVLLFADLFIIPADVVKDQISQTELIQYRNYSPTAQIHTKSGVHWFINQTGYELTGYHIMYKQSAIFKVRYDVYNIDRKSRVERYFPSFQIAAFYVCLMLLFAACIQFIVKKYMPERLFNLMQYNLIIQLIGFVFLLL
jgi:hypothetical protein